MVNPQVSPVVATVRLTEGEADGAGGHASADSRAAMPILRPGNAQWIGARTDQQDAFAFDGCAVTGAHPAGTVLVVLADGMGGLQAGREASRIAVATFRSSFAAQPTDVPVAEALETALRAANQAVHDLALATAGEAEVGTTLVAAAVRASWLHWVSVGDSRLYLYNGATRSLTRCTEDHNVARELQEQVNAGDLTPDEAMAHPDREALTSFLGLSQIPVVDRNQRPLALQPGDRLLLCSDGVDGVLTLDALAAPLAGDPQVAAEALIAQVRALALEHQDNATVAVLACEIAATPVPAVEPAPPAPRRRHWTALIAIVVALGLAAGALAWVAPAWWRDRAALMPSAETVPTPAANGDDVDVEQDVTIPAEAASPPPVSAPDAGRVDGVPSRMPESVAPTPVTPAVTVTPEPV